MKRISSTACSNTLALLFQLSAAKERASHRSKHSQAAVFRSLQTPHRARLS